MYKACVVLFPVELDQAHWAQSCEGGYFAVAAQVMIKNVNYGRDLIWKQIYKSNNKIKNKSSGGGPAPSPLPSIQLW